MKTTLYIVLFILINSCASKSNKNEIVYYDIYSSNKTVSGYYRNSYNYLDNNIRLDTVTRFDLSGNITDEIVNKYKISEDTLYLVDSDKIYPYYVISNNCNTLFFEDDEIETCFIRNEDNILVFTEKKIVIDGVKKELKFDLNFILLEEEYLDGYLEYYKIAKRTSVPSVLK